jgi:hypothetical protein
MGCFARSIRRWAIDNATVSSGVAEHRRELVATEAGDEIAGAGCLVEP